VQDLGESKRVRGEEATKAKGREEVFGREMNYVFEGERSGRGHWRKGVELNYCDRIYGDQLQSFLRWLALL